MRNEPKIGVATAVLALSALLTACTGSGSTSTEQTSAPPSSASAPTSPSSAPSEPHTDTQTATQVAPPTVPTSSAPEVPSGFAGTWRGRSRKLIIGSDGSVDLTFRLYIPCTADRTMGCDRVHGNDIEDGGRVVAHVTRVINSSTVIATVTETSAPETSPLGPVRIGRDLGRHALAIFGAGFNGQPFCGSQSPSGYCGA